MVYPLEDGVAIRYLRRFVIPVWKETVESSSLQLRCCSAVHAVSVMYSLYSVGSEETSATFVYFDLSLYNPQCFNNHYNIARNIHCEAFPRVTIRRQTRQ